MASAIEYEDLFNNFDSESKNNISGYDGLDEPHSVPTQDNTVNILLIGETGVGKSTFINSFANYLRFDSLEDVELERPLVLIPCKFTVTDENYEQRVVKIGADSNENEDLGKSATQDPRTYTFPISNAEKFICLIDTPGIGDTRGIDQDAINCQKIIDFIAPLKVIHGILFLLKPNSTKITVLFEFCMKQILSRLEKSASNNLLFTFTNTRGTCYRPGETLPCLRGVLEDISKRPPYVKIPLGKENIFCLDNEAFRYLAAIANGVQFTQRERQYFAESWEKSAEESWRMIIRIIGDDRNKPLEPHQVEHTICVNEARNVINQLKQPMADITHLIQDKLRVLQKQTEMLELDNLDIEDLKKFLVIPIIDIEVVELPEPVTVCTSSNCAKIYKVRDVKKWHYAQRCHNPCYLKNIPREMIGAPELVNCAAMDGSKKCKLCGCDYSTHMHIYYESKTVDKTIENDNVKQKINSKEELMNEKKKVIAEIKQIKLELEIEHKTIIHYIAKFANFLQHNAITPYNDVYREYIEYLIDREKSNGEFADKDNILYLLKCQKEYDEAKKIFDNALNMKIHDGTSILTPEAVKASVNELFKLKHTGAKIEALYLSQNLSRNSEHIYNNPSFQSSQDNIHKRNDDKGLISRYTTKFINYLSGSALESDEDNTSNKSKSSNKYTSYSIFNKKSKKRRKGKKKTSNDYENHLQLMEKEASMALAALSCNFAPIETRYDL
ncbi:hypothetical protein WA026_013032 [Henosepilachna vigintioctopunctata]|uniref:DUF8206 domain-containing protein n=1 Tax=Henosepilachna vigintioctopunctata TaxID=420089 RepID=A0AAW1UAP0_9CUCU